MNTNLMSRNLQSIESKLETIDELVLECKQLAGVYKPFTELLTIDIYRNKEVEHKIHFDKSGYIVAVETWVEQLQDYLTIERADLMYRFESLLETCQEAVDKHLVDSLLERRVRNRLD